MTFADSATRATKIRSDLRALADDTQCPAADRIERACALVVEYLRDVIEAGDLADSFEQITTELMPKPHRKRKQKPEKSRGGQPIALAPVVANAQSGEFHVRAFASGDCQVAEIAEPVPFTSVDAALAAGYAGCDHCLNRMGEGERTDGIISAEIEI